MRRSVGGGLSEKVYQRWFAGEGPREKGSGFASVRTFGVGNNPCRLLSLLCFRWLLIRRL